MMMSEQEQEAPLLQLTVEGTAVATHKKPAAAVAAWKRWYALCVFCATSGFQCFAWYGGIAASPAASKRFFGIGASTINLMVDYGPFAFLTLTFPAMLLASRRHGLRAAVIIAAALSLLGNVIRLLPALALHYEETSSSSEDASYSSRSSLPLGWLVVLHIGQIFTASGGPLLCASVTLLSFTWFTESGGRSTATTLGWQASNIGFSLAFAFAPLLAPTAALVPRLLIACCAITALPLVVSAIYYPEVSQELQHQQKVKFLPGVGRCIRNPHMLLCMLAGGVQNGVFGAWISVLPQTLDTLGYDPRTAGWLGFGCSLACIPGSVFVGVVADRWMQGKRKRLVLFIWGFTVLSFVWLAAMLQFKIGGVALVGCSLVIVGLSQGGIIPLFFELAAEITRPVNEGTSAGLITLANNVLSGVFLAFSAHISVTAFNIVLLCTFCVCSVATVFIRSENAVDVVGTSSKTADAASAVAEATEEEESPTPSTPGLGE